MQDFSRDEHPRAGQWGTGKIGLMDLAVIAVQALPKIIITILTLLLLLISHYKLKPCQHLLYRFYTWSLFIHSLILQNSLKMPEPWSLSGPGQPWHIPGLKPR